RIEGPGCCPQFEVTDAGPRATRQAVPVVGAVGRSTLRADCTAMLGLAAPSRNSLRSLRSLRSDRRAESDHEARCARGPQALRFSSPSDAPTAGTACRVASRKSLGLCSDLMTLHPQELHEPR